MLRGLRGCAVWLGASAMLAVVGCSLLSPAPTSADRSQAAATKPAARPTTSTRNALGKNDVVSAKALLPLDSIEPVADLPPGTEKPDRPIPDQAVKHYLAARDLFAQWMNAEAIEALEQAIRYDPGSFECRLLLGRAAHRAGNLGQARNHLREAAKLRPDDVVCQYLLGTLALKSKDLDEALLRFRLSLKCTNASAERAETVLAHLRLGEVLLERGHLSAAVKQIETYERAVADPRGRFWRDRELLTIIRARPAMPALLIGQAALQLRRYDQASDAFARALRRNPGSVRTKVRYAQAMSRAGHRDRALALANELLLSEKHAETGAELLAWIHKDAGNPEAVADSLRKLMVDHPERAGLALMLSDVLIGFDQSDEAERVLRELVKAHPRLGEGYVRLSALLAAQDRAADAVRVLADAIVAVPETHTAALKAAAQLGGKTQTVRQVVDGTDRILGADAENHALNYVVGLVAFHGDRKELAVRCFDRAIALAADFVPAYLSLGRLRLDHFEWDQAVQVARRAEKAGQKGPAIAYLLARAYDGLDDIEQATAAYQRVIKADPKSVAAITSLGQAYERVGWRNKARQEYQRALKLAPGHPVAGERLIRLLLAQGETAEAERVLKRFRRARGSRHALGRCLAVMASQGDMGRYRRLIDKLLEQSPKDVDTRYDLATSYYSTHDYDRARKEVDEILRLAPGHHKARFLLAGLCRKKLDFRGSAKVLAGLLTEHPNRHAWLLALAETYLDMQDFDRPTTIFKRLIERATSKPRRGAYRMRLVGVHGAAGRSREAVAAAERWLEEEPSSPTARRLLLDALHEDKQDGRAVRLAADWLAAVEADQKADDRAKRDARDLLIATQVAADRHDQALETLVGWTEADPSNRSLQRELWVVLYDAKRYEDAIEFCLSAIETSRQPQAYRLMLAQSYLQAKRHDEAMGALKRVPKSEQNALVRRLEILTLLAAKRYDEARDLAKREAGSARDDETRLSMSRLLVLIYQRQDRMDLAQAELERIYAKQPRDPGVNNDLGYTWADAGHNLDRAEQMIRYALGEDPRSAAYMDSLGWALYKKGDFAGAVHFLKGSARADGGEDPVIFDHLGDAYWRLGEREQAKTSWHRAEKLAAQERAENAEPVDPAALPRIRKKLAQVERGVAPSVAEVVGPGPSTRQSTRPAPASRQAVRPNR